MGLVVDQVVDVVEAGLAIEIGGDRPGVLGSAIINGRATEVLDVDHFLTLARTARVGRAA
jgi:two-component system chemotaxis sensor kinase CheA